MHLFKKNKVAIEKPLKDSQGIVSFIKSVLPNFDLFFPNGGFNRNDKSSETVINPYANNVWVYAAANAISTNLVQLPKVLDNVATEETEAITVHPILDVFENPNAFMSGSEFLENIILNLLLPTSKTKGGQCFIVGDSGRGDAVDLTRGDIPNELFPFSDEFFSPIMQNKTLAGWLFKPPNSAEGIPYKTSEVIRIYLVDPNDPSKGQAPIYADRSGLVQGAKADTVNERFFDNNASLGGTLETLAEITDKDQRRELTESFNQQFKGVDNAGKIALLQNGLKYQQFQRTHVDMQFLDQKKWSREEILAAYRVPKAEVALYEDFNFATAISADKSFWTKTVLPYDKRILSAINNQWIKFIDGGRFRLVSDTSKVEALQADLTQKLAQAKDLKELNVPLGVINERLELGLDLSKVTWSGTCFVPSSLVTAETVLEKPAETEEPIVIDEPEEEQDELDKIIEDMSRVYVHKQTEEDFHDTYINTVLTPDEKKYNKILRGYLLDQRNDIIKLVDKWAGTKSKAKVDGKEIAISAFSLHLATQNKELRLLVKPEYERQLLRETSQMKKELGPLINWKTNSPEAKVSIKRRLKVVAKINTTTFKAVRDDISRIINESINSNLTVPQTAKKLKTEIRKVYDGRINSNTIARTETNAIHSDTRFNVMKAEGVEFVQWLTAQDNLVRTGVGKNAFSHVKLNRKTKQIGEAFNNGEKIRYPYDDRASAGNVINCRCIIRAKRKEQ